jgi:hypothetical protein
MSSAFERLQKIAEEKRLREKAEKPTLEVVSNPVTNTLKKTVPKKQSTPSAPSAVSSASAPSAVSALSAGSQQPVAPEKDFTKVANSIVRQIPGGVFTGKSKQMYDYLYSLTRGAIKPSRTIRISKSALMRGSGIRSTHTFYNNIRHLEAIKLITSTRIDGEKGGNLYEVFVPEEINEDLVHLAHLAQAEQLAQLPHLEQSAQLVQKLPVAVSAVSALTALGPSSAITEASITSKTSLKTDYKNDDDRALAVFAQKLDEASQKLTGKGIKPNEAEKWGKLAELLVLELELAARNTTSISSVPAFLTEVLRRRLILQPEEKKQTRNAKHDQKKPDWVDVGRNYDDVESSYNPETGEYDIKPLDEAGKSQALELVREAQAEGGDFLEDLKKWYLPEDWDWLMKEIQEVSEIEEKPPVKNLQERIKEIEESRKSGSDNVKKKRPPFTLRRLVKKIPPK